MVLHFCTGSFFCFPRAFTRLWKKITLPPGSPLPVQTEGAVEIRFAAKIECACFVSNPDQIASLRDFHILREEVVAERFHFGEPPGIHVGFARVYRLSTPWILPMEKRFGGCRSWVELPEAPAHRLEAVIADEENARRSRKLRGLLKLD